MITTYRLGININFPDVQPHRILYLEGSSLNFQKLDFIITRVTVNFAVRKTRLTRRTEDNINRENISSAR